jgi:hypothetical protein
MRGFDPSCFRSVRRFLTGIELYPLIEADLGAYVARYVWRHLVVPYRADGATIARLTWSGQTQQRLRGRASSYSGIRISVISRDGSIVQ